MDDFDPVARFNSLCEQFVERDSPCDEAARALAAESERRGMMRAVEICTATRAEYSAIRPDDYETGCTHCAQAIERAAGPAPERGKAADRA